jgi:NADH-quinone oxidoreductase subunit C
MDKLSNEQIVEKLKNQFGDKVTKAYESYDMLTVHFERDVIHDALRFLKEDKDLNFFFMTDLCGMHYPFDKGHELGMVYMLHNMFTNTRIRVETFFPIEDPVIPTASDLWLAANWMERETYDFFGIIFEGHPDLRRILNMDEMDYFPMLKQYPLEDATRQDKNDAMFGR